MVLFLYEHEHKDRFSNLHYCTFKFVIFKPKRKKYSICFKVRVEFVDTVLSA